jgi:hypothetical protein
MPCDAEPHERLEGRHGNGDGDEPAAADGNGQGAAVGG